jgi:uncharacterized membrane protein YGL010W
LQLRNHFRSRGEVPMVRAISKILLRQQAAISLANSTGIVSSKPALLLLVRFALFLIVLDGVDIVSG